MSKLVVLLTQTENSGVDSRVMYGDLEPSHSQFKLPADQEAAMTAILKALRVPVFRPIDFRDDELEALRTRGYLVENGDTSRFDPRLTQKVGTELFGWLFPDKDTFSSYKRAQQDERTIDLELRFDPDARFVDSMPWELVYDGRDFVIAGRRGTLTRHLLFSGFAPPCPVIPVDKLRVLVIKSRPRDGVPELDDSELNAIRQVDGLDIELMQPPTLKRLGQVVDRAEPAPHVIHFDGHGLYGKRCAGCGRISGWRADECEYQGCPAPNLEPDPQGYLALEDANGSLDLVSAMTLANTLGDLTGNSNSPFRIVVLSACNTATVTGGVSAFEGMAQRLIREAVPAVVAMQFPIRSDAAADFSSRLYANLAAKRSLVESVARARNDLRVESGQWYRPVVYLRYRESGPRDAEVDGMFFSEAEPLPTPAPTPVVTSLSVDPDQRTTETLVKSINAALLAVANLVENEDAPRAHVQPVASFFDELHQQLDLLGSYKDIHDQLHELKLTVYARLRADFDGDSQPDDRTLSAVDTYDKDLARILVLLKGFASNVPPSDTTWIGDLDRAREELRDGAARADAGLVRLAVSDMMLVVENEPMLINKAMEDIARVLQLRKLSDVLKSTVGVASAATAARQALRVAAGVNALDLVAATLEQLVDQHTRWQKVDDRIPMARDQLARDRVRDFANLWSRIRVELVDLTSGGTDEWSLAIQAASAALDTAVRLADDGQIASLFQKCSSGVDQRFFSLDHELKQFCGEIRALGSGLDALTAAAKELVGANV